MKECIDGGPGKEEEEAKKGRAASFRACRLERRRHPPIDHHENAMQCSATHLVSWVHLDALVSLHFDVFQVEMLAGTEEAASQNEVHHRKLGGGTAKQCKTSRSKTVRH